MSEHDDKPTCATEDTVLGDSGAGGSAAELGAGQTIGRYEIRAVLGAGGMGVVYLARDTHLERDIAMKLLRSSAAPGSQACGKLCARLLQEAKAMARLSHPNLVTVFDVGTFRQRVFIAMEYIDGHTLTEWLRQPGRTWRDKLRAFFDAGQGLADAHEAGVAHRDFKPDNVLVSRKGRVKVADFGLARDVGTVEDHASSVRRVDELDFAGGTPLTVTGAVLGTPLYMSPEQLEGRVAGAHSDQFSFGVSLYRALYEAHPFDASDPQALRSAVLAGRMTPLPEDTDVPTAVGAAVQRALSTNPGDRFESMDAMLAVIKDALT